MAFGSIKGSFSNTATSIVNPFTALASVTVAVNDLIYVVIDEQTSVTTTAVADNLGNTYTATQAGTDGGTPTGIAFYSIVTVAGSLTSVSATCTGSAHDAVIFGDVTEGPFSGIGANPTNTTDATSPYDCPATGTLDQPNQVIKAWITSQFSDTVAATATSPNIESVHNSASANAQGTLGSQVVSSITTVTPQFTQAADKATVLGTTSFKGFVSLQNKPLTILQAVKRASSW